MSLNDPAKSKLEIANSARRIFGQHIPLWIAHAQDTGNDGWPHYGYHSSFSFSSDTEKWIKFDLSQEEIFDTLSLYPLFPFTDGVDISQWRISGSFFPRSFRVDVSNDATFLKFRTVASWEDSIARRETDVDDHGAFLGWFENEPLEEPVILGFAPVLARYVRITATKLSGLYSRNDHLKNSKPKQYAFALAAVKILNQDLDLASKAIITASDQLSEAPRYSPDFLVDGRETTLPPSTCFRKEFTVFKAVKQATLKATARGIYHCQINGQDTTDNWYAPEWTDYDSRLLVQSSDVTGLMKIGENAVSVTVGNGWLFGTQTGGQDIWHPYGCYHQFLGSITLEYADGSYEYILTDGTWNSSTKGPWRRCELYIGEVYDERMEQPGWEYPGFNQAGWLPVNTAEHDWQPLAPQEHDGIKVAGKYPCLSVRETDPGEFLLDFGKNLLGICTLTLSGYPGRKIRIQYAQCLLPDGRADCFNLGWRMQRDNLIPATNQKITFTPRFAAHGFRYVRISGLAVAPVPADAEALFLHSACEEAGEFSCSSDLLNSIVQAAQQTLLSNRFSVSTDSAARERGGWPTSAECYSGDLYMNRSPDFYANIQQNMIDYFDWYEPERRGFAMGAFCVQSPYVYAYRKGHVKSIEGSMTRFAFAWSDAMLPLSIHLYEHYGDKKFLEKPFFHICALMNLLEEIAPKELDAAPCIIPTYGDWLDANTFYYPLWHPNGPVFSDVQNMHKLYAVDALLFSYAFLAHDFALASQIASCLCQTEISQRWQIKFQFLRQYFNRHFMLDSGRLSSHTQGAYALSLGFDLVPDEKVEAMLAHLDNTLILTGCRPATGIMTTALLLKTLSRFGRHDKAMRMMLSTGFPSFGYMIEQGATTIWERWDTDVWQRNQLMNDHNHRDFCGFMDWVWQCLAGLRPDRSAPGFKHFIIAPQPDSRLTWMNARYRSEQGLIAIKWEAAGDCLTIHVTVPEGCSAAVLLPEGFQAMITLNGQALKGNQEKLLISGGEHIICARARLG